MIGSLALEVLYLNDYKAYSDDVAACRLSQTHRALEDALEQVLSPTRLIVRQILRDLNELVVR